MLLWKIFGTLDLACALLLYLVTWTEGTPWRLVLAGAAYLVFKGILYLGDVGSLADMLVGVYLLVALVYAVPILSTAFIVFLSVKGVWSYW